MPIRLLPAHLASQIASGEVIERPASVVKELIENAMDAGARRINIRLEKGGIQLIQIYDDGEGMDAQDLSMSTKAHTTSKIEALDDLQNIATMGFRGEALASIDVASQLKIASRTATDRHGWQLVAGEVQPVACEKGTQVTVSRLFYNLPARRKFLRSATTELRHCTRIISQLALARPDIALCFEHGKQRLFDFGNQSDALERRIKKLCGRDFFDAAVAVDVSQGALRIHGYLARPVFSRAQPDMQYWFVNRRALRDKFLNAAVRRAYRDAMYHDRHPAFALYLDVPTADIDVNVHPAKHEIRFNQPEIFQFIQQSVHHVISTPIKERATDSAAQTVPTVTRHLQQKATPDWLLRPALKPEAREQYSHFVRESISKQAIESSEEPLGEALNFVHGAFIISVNDAGMCVIDAHGAHERILYEKLKNSRSSIAAQRLLVPITIKLGSEEMQVLEEYRSCFETLRFDIEALSGQSVVVRQVPSALLHQDVKKLLTDTISDLRDLGESERPQAHMDTLLSMVACHGSARANRALNIQEMNALLRQLETTRSGEVCNHGRPVIRHFSIAEMDGWFKRGH